MALVVLSSFEDSDSSASSSPTAPNLTLNNDEDEDEVKDLAGKSEAALTIQRAFRRYSLVRSFQRLKRDGPRGTLVNGCGPCSCGGVEVRVCGGEGERKRIYRAGLNLFNVKPRRGIGFLAAHGFLDPAPHAVAKFLCSRKGVSKQLIGDFLADPKTHPQILQCFLEEIPMEGLGVDVALRKFQEALKLPGEAQKIERLMEAFANRYAAANPSVAAEFEKGSDTIFILAFAIIMLNTDAHTPHLKADRRMKVEEFVGNLRGVDGGGDLPRELLVDVYNGIKSQSLQPGPDHVTQVLKVQMTMTGDNLPNLAVPHRRLVCYCRLYHVSDVNKRDKPGSHQRECFLFNDVLVLTKKVEKRRGCVGYAFRQSIQLAGLSVNLFSTAAVPFGLALDQLLLAAKNDHDRVKFAEDLREAVAESDLMHTLYADCPPPPF